jgi:hypothetical protein
VEGRSVAAPSERLLAKASSHTTVGRFLEASSFALGGLCLLRQAYALSGDPNASRGFTVDLSLTLEVEQLHIAFQLLTDPALLVLFAVRSNLIPSKIRDNLAVRAARCPKP